MASLGMVVIGKLTFMSTPVWRWRVADLFQGSLSREHFFLLGYGIETELLEKPMQLASSALLPIFPLFLTKLVRNPGLCKIIKSGPVRPKLGGSVQHVDPAVHDELKQKSRG